MVCLEENVIDTCVTLAYNGPIQLFLCRKLHFCNIRLNIEAYHIQ